jgi:hypothetical protein
MQVSQHVLFPYVEAAGLFKTLIPRIIVKDEFFKNIKTVPEIFD